MKNQKVNFFSIVALSLVILSLMWELAYTIGERNGAKTVNIEAEWGEYVSSLDSTFVNPVRDVFIVNNDTIAVPLDQSIPLMAKNKDARYIGRTKVKEKVQPSIDGFAKWRLGKEN